MKKEEEEIEIVHDPYEEFFSTKLQYGENHGGGVNEFRFVLKTSVKELNKKRFESIKAAEAAIKEYKKSRHKCAALCYDCAKKIGLVGKSEFYRIHACCDECGEQDDLELIAR